MIGVVLGPLGLPVEAVLIIMMAVDAVIDPMRTFLIVYVNMRLPPSSCLGQLPRLWRHQSHRCARVRIRAT
jgi:hypothetical protein